jgi:hypothetical protein
VAAIGCAYTLILIPLAIMSVVKGKRFGSTSAARILIFTDVVSISSLYSSIVELLKFVKI